MIYLLQDAYAEDVDFHKSLINRYSASSDAAIATEQIVYCPELFETELKIALDLFADNSFMSYKNLNAFECTCYYRLLHMLDDYYQMNKNGAIKAGERMICLLEDMNSDDCFPEYHISQIKDVISAT